MNFIIKTMAGLISQGRFSFAEVDLIREDTLFKKSINMDLIYAPETVRI